MKISVLRKRSKTEKQGWQIYEYDLKTADETVATALTNINKENPDNPVSWDCGCLQKKCGACAMVINGRPGLACGVKLTDIKGELKLEPLRKFPVIKDLLTDRSILHSNLFNAGIWLEEKALSDGKKQALLYEASRCLQCGCCVEVCPNFYPEGKFFGMASAVPAARLLMESEKDGLKRLKKSYKEHVYKGCGKSLSCRNICPVGIDIESLLVKANAGMWRWHN